MLEQWEECLKAEQVPGGNFVVLVDEAQDNNITQMNIVRKLAGTEGRICLFGDLRQCVHEWRGSHPDLFRSADVDLGATTKEIFTNYRSEAPIVALANHLAIGKSWSLGSPAKPSFSTDDSTHSVELLPPTFGPDEEADIVAKRISDDIQAGEAAGNYAILCRTNAGRAMFEAALTRRNVPISVIGGSSVFRTREAEVIMAYAVLSQHDAIGSLDKILNQPRRFIPHSFVAAVHQNLPSSADIIDAIQMASKSFKLKPGSRRGVQELITQLQQIRAVPWKDVPKIVEKLIKSDPSREAEAADEDRQSLYSTTCRVAEKFNSPLEFVSFAQRCCDGTAALAEGTKPTSCVTLSTCHSAKGLEWKHVYVSANRSMFPHLKSTNREEENRLFYVAVTRAVRKVTFSWNKQEGLTSFLPPVEKLKEFCQVKVGVT